MAQFVDELDPELRDEQNTAGQKVYEVLKILKEREMKTKKICAHYWNKSIGGKCGNRAITDGGFCKVHDPESMVMRAKSRHDKWRRDMDQRCRLTNKIARKREAGREAIKILNMIANDPNYEPIGMAQEFLIKYKDIF